VTDKGAILARSILVPLDVVPKGTELPEREASTYVIIRDDQTLDIGGLKISEAEAKKKVPILGKLPVLGKLFRSSDKKITKQEMLIFITPRVILPAE